MTPLGPTRGGRQVRLAILSGLCASLVGIGLARFAYTPLLPALVGAGWFAAGQAAYLGAANLAGYLAGALAARPLAARAPARGVLRGMMLLAGLTFFGCSAPVSFAWFFAWRFASGFAGGAIMALAAPTILPSVPPRRRGLAGGAIFTGVGLGVAASGTLLPFLLQGGLQLAWLALGGAALALTAAAWPGWPAEAPRPPPTAAAAPPGRELRLVILLYGLNGAAMVPHMVFLVDYVARGLGRGLAAGAACWVAFGLGAMAGPLALGAFGDRIGFRAATRVGLATQALAIAAPALLQQPAALLVSAAVQGAFTPGVVPLALGRIHALAAPGSDGARLAWGRATAAFACGQAVAAYGMSYLFAAGGAYRALFGIGAAIALATLALDVAASRAGPEGRT